MGEIDALVGEIFDGVDASYRAEFAGWIRRSRRFKAFASAHRSKIRAKLRNAGDASGLDDIRAELETARVLLHEDRFELAYEAYSAARQRGPDFTVTFKGHTRFNVEVRRVRAEAGIGDVRGAKLAAILSQKARQMPPSIVNILWLVTEAVLSEDDIGQAAAGLRRRSEQKEGAYFLRHGYATPAEFLRQFQLLSSVAVPQADMISLWHNAIARHKMPPDVTAAIRRLRIDRGA
jgi:hypothetical protein